MKNSGLPGVKEKNEEKSEFFADPQSGDCEKRENPGSLLAVAVILDAPGSRRWRVCGKLFGASFLRHLWGGRVTIARNFEEPLFPVERAGLAERPFAGAVFPKDGGAQARAEQARRLILETTAETPDAGEADWVLLADADCLALRNPDHLFAVRGADLLVSPGPDGTPDPGFVAVRGARLEEFCTRLAETGGLSAGGLGELAESGDWRTARFERGEVVRPTEPGMEIAEVLNAAIVHFSGMEPEDKQRLAFALHMAAVYGDDDGMFFDLLEA